MFTARLALLGTFLRIAPFKLPNVFYRLILHKFGVDNPFSLKIGGRRIYFPSTDELYMVRQNLDGHIYDVNAVNPERIIDLGANIGLVSIFYALKYPNATIDAYEPDPRTYEFLIKNTRGLNVRCHQEAIADKRGMVPFYCADKSVASRLGTLDTTLLHPKALKISIAQKMLVPAIMPEDLGHADIIKIDIEGAEQLLQRHPFDAGIIVGESDYKSKDIISKLFPNATWTSLHIFVTS
jgi:FkbM family methyltransferase